jgi:hypothetical protein
MDVWTGIAQSVKRLATNWAVGASNPCKGEISAAVRTGPTAHPAFYTSGNESPSQGESGRGVGLNTHHI